MATQGPYQLERRNRGGLVLGMPAPQAALTATGLVIMLGLTALTQTLTGFMVGAGMATLCAGVAFAPIDGQPALLIVPALTRFLGSRLARTDTWLAPLPRSGRATTMAALPTGSTRRKASLGRGPRTAWPRCLTGLELLAEPRPPWAGAGNTPIGIVHDRRSGMLTVVLPVRGGPFSLQESETQHAQLAGWGQVLTQFGRESSPVARIGWSLWSSPGMNDEHLTWLQQHTAQPGLGGPATGSEQLPLEHPQSGRATRDYLRVLQQQGPSLYQHQLRVWITVESRHRTGRHDSRAHVALAAGQALAERCAAAGLLPGPALSPAQLAQALRAQADPRGIPQPPQAKLGLAQRAGLAPALPGSQARPDPASAHAQRQHTEAADAAPLAVRTHWDAVQVDGAWHRSFWVAHWPAGVSDPRWLEPLVLNPVGHRAMTVIYEPISLRASRRRITADAVALDSQLQLRDKHEFRIPVHLRAAHAEIDQRETELSAGYTEYGHLTLITVTASTPDDLDRDCQALLDQAAQAGITDLRPLHGRHDAAWACTLPIGRVPNRELMNGAGL